MKEKQKKEATSSWGCRFDGSFTLKEFANGIGLCDRNLSIPHKDIQCKKP